MEKYLCEICGKKHQVYYGASSLEPDYIRGLSEEEREKRVREFGYLLLIDESFLIIKGTIFIEVKGISKWVFFEVWVRIEVEDFQRKLEEEKNENYDNPLYGKLESELFSYYNVKNLKVEVFFPAKGDDGDLIQLEIAEETHPMFLDQKNGISKEKLISWMQEMYHSKPPNAKKASFKVSFRKIIKEAKTEYFKKQKSFIINVAEEMVLFQIVSADIFFFLEKTKNGFGIYLPFDTSREEAEVELERFKTKKYFEKFELDFFDEMPTYYLMVEEEKELINLSAKIIKEVYEVKVQDVEFDIFEP